MQHVGVRGKFIYMGFDDYSLSLWSTLGLTGGWTFDPRASRHNRISLTFRQREAKGTDIETKLYFFDARNFGTFRVSFQKQELEEKLQSLGFDWLATFNDASSDKVFHSSQLTVNSFVALGIAAGKYKRPLCVFLMDQSKTSGIGNYILSEALYIARIHPFACSSSLSRESWVRLYNAIKEVISKSYLSQCPTEVFLEMVTSSEFLDNQFQFLIYGQDKTRDIGNVVRREVGTHKRTIHWDPILQTLHCPN